MSPLEPKLDGGVLRPEVRPNDFDHVAAGDPRRPVDEMGSEIEQGVVTHIVRSPAPAPIADADPDLELAGRRHGVA